MWQRRSPFRLACELGPVKGTLIRGLDTGVMSWCRDGPGFIIAMGRNRWSKAWPECWEPYEDARRPR
jgi:hypothetical protein